MRAGVSTVQQTLTAEAASILKQAVSEACKRGHAQATPLHVAATLLVSPSSPLRRACLQTHPHSSHLPQCRALELCFNIALERLQAAQGPLPNGQPSYSNALVAALKRAQAHQRRGCPEQQQQPLLAVKVELEQLIISILDDPSVSRVMREAGFSSTDVKSHLEEMVSLMASHHSSTHGITDPVRFPWNASAIDQISFRLGGVPPAFLGGFPLPHHLPPLSNASGTQERNDMSLHVHPPLRTHSPYMNPLLLKPGVMASMANGGEERNQVLDTLLRKKMRNPLLLNESAARLDGVIKDVIQNLERGNVPEKLQGVKVLSANLSFLTLVNASKEDLHLRFMNLNKSVQELILNGGVVVNVGNLQWLLQLRASASQLAGFCPVQHAAHEVKELFARHRDCNRLWLIGTATNQAYRNFQALYPELESQWELQPVYIGTSAAKTLSSRCSSKEAGMDSLTLSLLPSGGPTLQLSSFSEDNGETLICCLDCTQKYEKEALLCRDQECVKHPDSPQSCSSSVETPSKTSNDQGPQATSAPQPVLPRWLQNALSDNSSNVIATAVEVKQKAVPLAPRLQELRRKWNQTCRSSNPERTGWNAAFDGCQQPSSLSSQVSGNPSERTLTLLRENSSGPRLTKPMAGSIPALTAHQTSRILAPSLALPNMPNSLSEQLLQARAHKDRVQDNSNGCSASLVRLPWPAASAVMPMMRSTEATIPSSMSDCLRPAQSSRLFARMNLEALDQLCKGLAKKVGWQPSIISTVANTVMQCRSGLGKRAGPGVSLRSDTWLLFLGHDRPGKRLMAEALAELSFGEDKKPICLTFGKQEDLSSPATSSLGRSVTPRGKMPLDQLVEAVRLNPSSLLYFEDVEHADSIFRSGLMQAMSRGRLLDSSGRDVSFSSVIIVMASSAGLDGTEVKATFSAIRSRKECSQQENESYNYSQCSHEQWLVGKRKGSWDVDDDPKAKGSSCISKRPHLSQGDLDLNMAAAEENEKVAFSVLDMPVQESCNAVGTTRPQQSDEEVLLGAQKQLGELCDLVDAAVVFASSM